MADKKELPFRALICIHNGWPLGDQEVPGRGMNIVHVTNEEF